MTRQVSSPTHELPITGHRKWRKFLNTTGNTLCEMVSSWCFIKINRGNCFQIVGLKTISSQICSEFVKNSIKTISSNEFTDDSASFQRVIRDSETWLQQWHKCLIVSVSLSKWQHKNQHSTNVKVPFLFYSNPTV